MPTRTTIIVQSLTHTMMKIKAASTIRDIAHRLGTKAATDNNGYQMTGSAHSYHQGSQFRQANNSSPWQRGAGYD